MPSGIKLEVFTDFVCPWCYLATPRVEKLKRNFNVEVEWIYFPLHPDTPQQGLLLSDLFAGRGIDIEAAHTRLKGLLEAEGLQFNARTHTYNSRLAQELAKAFPSDGLRERLYKAYFQDAKNIGDLNVLLDVAEAAGISRDDARLVLTERTSKDAVDADWAKAHRYGITGVPCFVADNRKLAGAQPYEVLEKLVLAAGAERKAVVS